MKMRVAFLSLVALLCLVAQVMAGPIPIGAPPSGSDATASGKDGPRPASVSSSHSSAPGNFGSLAAPLSMGSVGSDHLTIGPLPPTPAPVPEPSGLMVMLGSGLFGAAAWLRRGLKA